MKGLLLRGGAIGITGAIGALLLEMSTDLPVLIEIVDSEEKIKLLLPHLERMVQEGMITMECAIVLMYRHNESREKNRRQRVIRAEENHLVARARTWPIQRSITGAQSMASRCTYSAVTAPAKTSIV